MCIRNQKKSSNSNLHILQNKISFNLFFMLRLKWKKGEKKGRFSLFEQSKPCYKKQPKIWEYLCIFIYLFILHCFKSQKSRW